MTIEELQDMYGLEWVDYVEELADSSQMIEVYAECNGYAEPIAVFKSESDYLKALPELTIWAKSNGFTSITESIK